jgi:hypothetical protein
VRIEVSLVWQEVAKERAFRGGRIIEAVEPHSGLTEELLCIVGCHVPVGLWDVRDWVGEIALVCITSNHRETGWERFNNSLASVRVKEVVSNSCQQGQYVDLVFISLTVIKTRQLARLGVAASCLRLCRRVRVEGSLVETEEW